jgi:hypothetical protein
MNLHFLSRLVKVPFRTFGRNGSIVRGKGRSCYRLRLELLEDRTLLDAVHWKGGSGEWSDPNHWDLRVPGAGDDAIIGTADVTVTHSSGTDAVKSITSAAMISISGGSLQVAEVLRTTAPLEVNSATLTGTRVEAPALTLLNGGTLTHPTSTATQMYKLELQVADTLSVDGTSKIDVSGRGYVAGQTTGNTTAGAVTRGGGGSYGGWGGAVGPDPASRTNAVYGSYADPNDWGTGGFVSSGGGLVRIVAATLQLQGQLLANGASSRGGSGSGGGIYVAVTTLAGDGLIRAAGGEDSASGNGGGGRIAVYAQQISGFDVQKITAPGGAAWMYHGGAGTIYLRNPGDAQGTLIIDNGTSTANNGKTPLGLPERPDMAIPDKVIIRNNGTHVVLISNITVTGDLTLTSADLSGSQDLTVTHNFLWFGSSVTGSGATILAPGAELTVEESDVVTDRPFHNAGKVIKHSGFGTLTFLGTFDNSGTVEVQVGTLSVVGPFSQFSGTTLTGGTYIVSATFQFNNADIQTNAGTIVLDGLSPRIVNESNQDALKNLATNAAGGTFTLRNGSRFSTATSVTFSNMGTLVVGVGCTFTISGGFANFAGATLTGGEYRISGTLQFRNADIQTNLANIVLDGWSADIVDLANNDALLDLATNAGRLTIQNGDNIFLPSALSNAGALIIGSGSSLTINGAYTQTGSTSVLNNGRLILAGGGSNSGNFDVGMGGFVFFYAGMFSLDNGTTIGGDGVYQVGGDGIFQIPGNTLTIQDAVSIPNLELHSGLLTGPGALSITKSFVWIGGTMGGTGAINIAAHSTLTLNGRLDKALGDRTLNLNGMLTGSGTVVGDVVNSGLIVLTGILNVRGNYTQTADGTLNVVLGSPPSGNNYGRLVVTVHASLGGTLDVDLINDFTPNLGDNFHIMGFGSLSGAFAMKNGLDLGNGLQLELEYGDTSLTLITTGGRAPSPGGSAGPNAGHGPCGCLDQFFGLLGEMPRDGNGMSLGGTNSRICGQRRISTEHGYWTRTVACPIIGLEMSQTACPVFLAVLG